MKKAALVSVSKGVMESLLCKLTKLLEEEYGKLRGVSKQIKFLRDELSAMSAALQMLADAEQLNPLMRAWRDKLRELAYDIEDCIDSFMARPDHDGDGGPTGILGLFCRFKKLISCHPIANEIEELKKRAVEISDRHKRYNFADLPSSSSTAPGVDPRLPALYEEIDRLVGIGGPKKHIIQLLAMETNGHRVISIVGCGGLGKTTLANQVYHTIKNQFDCASFVSVSRTPDIRKILRDIAKEVRVTYSTTSDDTSDDDDDEGQPVDKLAKEVGDIDITLDDDEQQLVNKLKKYLKKKRYFVVIDDVWDAEAWKFIKLALPNNDRSRIVTTTRSVTVAKCSSSKDRHVYEMKPLSFTDSKRLFFRRAFGSENSCYPHLNDVPDRILRKCGGLPLAVITISSMLTNKHEKAEWDRVQSAIGSAFAEKPEAEKMVNILSLSYFDMPHHLRTCLLYLSVFPEDYRIEKQCLINRWIAEGFVQEEQGQNAYERGEHYFYDLINRSLIQPVDIEYDDQAEACRVHDIILDYIKCKAAEENFVMSLDAVDHIHTSEYKVRRLCVININEERVTLLQHRVLSNVRSLTISGHCVKTSLLHFNALLRVLDLDLGNFWMEDHDLTSIEKLCHLKYLRLRSISITKLPEKIGELKDLQTLDVQGTRLQELPSTIRDLKRLAHLYIDPCTKFPERTIGQMHSLEELRTYGVDSYEKAKSLKEFSKLTKLRTLEMRWGYYRLDFSEGTRQVEEINSYVGKLLSSCNICNLYILGICFGGYPIFLDSRHPGAPYSLQKLCMQGYHIYKVPNWMGSHRNLSVLELLVMFLSPEDVEILGEISSLLFLTLCTAGGSSGRITVHGNNRFRSLKYFSLSLFACGTAIEFEATSMPKLEHLKLVIPAHNVECLNGSPNMGIQHLSALSKVEIEIGNDLYDGTLGYVNAAIGALPNSPTVRVKGSNAGCVHFKSMLRT